MTPVAVGLVRRVLNPGRVKAVLRTVSAPLSGQWCLLASLSCWSNWDALGSPWTTLAVTLPTAALVYLVVVVLTGPQHLRELRSVTVMLNSRSETIAAFLTRLRRSPRWALAIASLPAGISRYDTKGRDILCDDRASPHVAPFPMLPREES